ncbi:MauE/DoxX family redox-associated membrane protein [Mucilaginibacter panaciglaebae]|uniref:Methylamine utilisation protein MauE domain-containing protein n=1 Tax=Mucilaginibacter panaciglaebae TaxID=502331 RepID=A0ABP7WK91_9SPHI
MNAENNLPETKKTSYTDIVVALITAIFVLLFSYTSISKFLDYNRFVFQMRQAPIPIVKSIAPFLGWLIPIVESTLVIGLLIKKTRAISLFASVLLLVAFEFYIGGMLLSGLDLPCTCGGIISTMSWNQHLLFNGIVILIGTIAIIKFQNLNFLRPFVIGRKRNKELSRA